MPVLSRLVPALLSALLVTACSGSDPSADPSASKSPPSNPDTGVAVADDFETFQRDMTYFYLDPSREAFESLQARAGQFREGFLEAGDGVDLLVAVMIARISSAHGWPIADGAFAEQAREIAAGRSPLAQYIENDAQVDPTKLDVWWASFFATGEERYLEKILEYAGMGAPDDDDFPAQLVQGAAAWSFASNCNQHERVLEFARRKLQSPSVTESESAYLEECIARATEQPADPAGEPSARASHPPVDSHENADDDINWGVSRRTIAEAQSFLTPGMTSDELHAFLQTTPALVRDGRFHWRLRDGSMWTDFEMRPEGAVIVNVEVQRAP